MLEVLRICYFDGGFLWQVEFGDCSFCGSRRVFCLSQRREEKPEAPQFKRAQLMQKNKTPLHEIFKRS